MMELIDFPEELKGLIDFSTVKKAPIGFSGDCVLIIEKGYQNKDIVLKYSKRKEVHQEGLILKWLEGKVKVPLVYLNIEINGVYYLVMEKLKGQMGQEGFKQLGIERMIEYYAKLIKQFHQIDYSDFFDYNTLDVKLKHTQYNVKHHLVKTQYFERELQGKSAQEVYDLMMSLMPKDFDLVLCHGDVCMPNFLIDHGKLSGWIDVIGCGVNDRHLDLAIALRTLRYNLEAMGLTLTKDYKQLFIKSYGIDVLDENKIKFYILLDELTNG